MSAEELIASPPRAGSDRMARLLGRFCSKLAFGSLLLRFPDGGALLYRGAFAGPSGELSIRRPLRFLARLIARGEIGFAESYMEGDWETPDLVALLDSLSLNEEHLGTGPKGLPGSRWLDRIVHRLRDNRRGE